MMADPKKECEYQASLERTGFLTTGQPAALTERRRAFPASASHQVIPRVTFQ